MITSTSPEQLKQGSFRSFDPNLLSGMGRLAALLLACVIMSMISPVFFSARNLSNIVTNACVMTILGVGLTITVITCGPDLSVGSILTITSVIAAIMIKAGIFFVWAFLAALALGVLLGLLNGLMISKIGIPSFISTYGLQWAVFGFRLRDSQGLRRLRLRSVLPLCRKRLPLRRGADAHHRHAIRGRSRLLHTEKDDSRPDLLRRRR